MPSRAAKSIVTAYSTAHAIFVKAGLRPQLQRLDNEASAILQQSMTEQNIDFQLAPPHLHRRNAAERAIHTFKNHFIAGLCSTDPLFPLHLWDRLIPQALITLNLMRGSRLNPKLSAHAQVHGQFDFNRTPLAPPGTKVLVHEKPAVRGTWSPHGVDGWYVGPALNHYRCYKVWIKETSAERVADTLTWLPRHVTMPGASPADAAAAAARDLIKALLNPAPVSPLAPLADSQRQALFQLADIFASATHPDYLEAPTAPTPRPSPLKVTFQVPLPNKPNNNTAYSKQKDTPWPRPADTVAPPRVPTAPVPEPVQVPVQVPIPSPSPTNTVAPPRVPILQNNQQPGPVPIMPPAPIPTIPPPRVARRRKRKTNALPRVPTTVPTNAPKKSSKPTYASKARVTKKPSGKKLQPPKIILPTTTAQLSPAAYICLPNGQHGKSTTST
eukprot:scaffold15131_cov65-Attheya_sp.AAC.1